MQSVLNETQEQLREFIRLPKPIDIAGRVSPDLVADSMNTQSVQKVNISFIQKLRVHMLIS